MQISTIVVTWYAVDCPVSAAEMKAEMRSAFGLPLDEIEVGMLYVAGQDVQKLTVNVAHSVASTIADDVLWYLNKYVPFGTCHDSRIEITTDIGTVYYDALQCALAMNRQGHHFRQLIDEARNKIDGLKNWIKDARIASINRDIRDGLARIAGLARQ